MTEPRTPPTDAERSRTSQPHAPRPPRRRAWRRAWAAMACAALVGGASLASAEPPGRIFPHDEAQVRVTVPAKWELETEEDLIQVQPPDGSVVVILDVLLAKTLPRALDALDTELRRVVQRPRLQAQKAVEIHGLQGYRVDGEATVDGVRVDLNVLVVETPSGRVLVGMAFGAHGRYERHRARVEGIFASVTPL